MMRRRFAAGDSNDPKGGHGWWWGRPHKPVQTGRVTAELALPQDSWLRELRGICERLSHAPGGESLAAMTLSVDLDSDQGQEMALRQLSQQLAREYGLRQTVTCAAGCCNIRLARNNDAGD